MEIRNVRVFSPNLEFKPNLSVNNIKLNKINADVVSFSSHSDLENAKKNENIKSGVNLGKEIYKQLQKGAKRSDIADLIKSKD